jgi:hypothetical protein
VHQAGPQPGLLLRRPGDGGGLPGERGHVVRGVRDQQHRDGRQHEDRALDEQGGPVHRDGAHRRQVPGGPLGEDRRGRRDHAGPDERRHQGAERHQQVEGPAQLAGHEGLDEHADDGRAEDDQHRRELAVLDARRRDVTGSGSSDSDSANPRSGEAHGWAPFWAAAG